MEHRVGFLVDGQRVLAAIMVTDAVGFSARMSVNEGLTLRLIDRDLALIAQVGVDFGGRVLKSTGDGVLMYFLSAVEAVSCGLEIQRRLVEQSAGLPSEQYLDHRIGIHLGDIVVSKQDVMGNGVNIAARLQNYAKPRGLCISQTVFDVVKARLSLEAIFLGALELKNIREPVPAYQVNPYSAPTAEPDSALPSPQKTADTTSIGPGNQRSPSCPPTSPDPALTGWRRPWQRWRPTRREALFVSVLAAISLIPAVANWVPQAWLMDQRVATQAVYRDLTGQIPADDPPVVMVQVDGKSFSNWGATDYNPINRAMLAEIITEIRQRQAPVIGIDYILDLAQPAHDADLRQALESTINQGIWPVVATTRQGGDWLTPHPTVIDSERLLLGDVWVPWWRMWPQHSASHLPDPFSYQLTVAHRLHERQTDSAVPRPSLDGPPLAEQVATYRQQHDVNLPRRATINPITAASTLIQQEWLQPLIDFSLPPDRVFASIPAWQLWENAAHLPDLTNAVVIVAPGGYHSAGLVAAGEDNMPIPPALAHWRRQANQPTDYITGGEAHAYMVHHLLTNHLVVPIPDLWMILVTAGLGKALSLYLAAHPRPRWQVGLGLGLGTLGYGLLSLQIYISGAVMLPWLLPSLVVWCYGLPSLRGKADATN
ncbi:MAG: CHASE2 domain-containing protein [Leptolyngbya sp.]|nr:CHASE2 domain-containing protein [Leptolyngbya sp.]